LLRKNSHGGVIRLFAVLQMGRRKKPLVRGGVFWREHFADIEPFDPHLRFSHLPDKDTTLSLQNEEARNACPTLRHMPLHEQRFLDHYEQRRKATTRSQYKN